MKRIFSILAACATMVALAACQKEVQETVQPPVLDEGLDGELVEVTFAVDVTDAEQTKTISDGLSATNLLYAVYRAEEYVANDGKMYPKGQYIPSLSQGDDPDADFSNAKIEKQGDRTWLVTLTLAKNVKYDIVFWAYADEAPYTFDEPNAKITVDDKYTGLANAENRDAFYGICREYSVISSETKVELRRPFAQINFGASDYIPYITDLGLNITSTIDTRYHAAVEAVYENNDPENGRLLYPYRPSVASCKVPTILNVLTGGVGGGAEVNFATQAIPYENDDQVLLTTGTGENEVTYHWMGMNYILASESRASIDNIHAVFTYNGYDLVVDVPNVPYKRNYKTNIIGDIFTGPATFNVVIMPEYTDTYVDSFDGFEVVNPIEETIKDAVAAGKSEAQVTLINPLILDKTLTVPEGVTLKLDLGGNTFTSKASTAFLVNGSLELTGGEAVVAGEFIRAGKNASVMITEASVVSGSETVAGDNCIFVPSAATNVAVVVGEGAELTSYTAAAIQSNGATEGLQLEVYGKVTSVGRLALYLPQVGECVIGEGAEVEGITGVEVRAGKLTVKNGAKIAGTTNRDDFSAIANGSGSVVNGTAVSVAPHSTNLPISVKIEGGEFSGVYALYEVNTQSDRTAATTLVVEGGKFYAPVYSQNCTGFIYGGEFTVEVPESYMAK